MRDQIDELCREDQERKDKVQGTLRCSRSHLSPSATFIAARAVAPLQRCCAHRVQCRDAVELASASVAFVPPSRGTQREDRAGATGSVEGGWAHT